MLLKLNREYEKLFDDNKEKFEKIMEDEKKVLAELEEVVRHNKPVPEKLKQRVFKAEERARAVHRMVDETTVSYSKMVVDVFTEEQMDVIAEFKPCTVPPKNLSDPVRVGQASDNERVINILRRIRQMPRHMFEENIEKIVDRQMEHLNTKKRLKDAEKQEERQRLKELLWKVHVMDEVQFEMCKEELADEFKWKDKADDLKKELNEIQKTRHPRAHRDKASKYFLDPKVIPVLEERLEKIRNADGGLKGGKASKPRRKNR